MNERIREFLVKENKSSAQLAEEIGVQPSGISHILSGRNHPSLDFIIKMLEKYPFLSTDWLLFGKGSMYEESRNESLFIKNTDLPENEAFFLPHNELLKGNISGKPLINQKDRSFIPEAVKNGTSSVVKIILFYSDKHFEEFYPNS